jgi:hypothetical protein
VEPDDGFTLRLARKPEAIIAEANMCATALMAAVRKNGWAVKFSEGGKEHLYFEAWSLLSSMYRVTPRVKETRLVQIGDVTGYEATAEAFHGPSGVVISTADSMCLDDEDKWADRPVKEWKTINGERKKVPTGEFTPVPLFQLRSMAQTRAMAKALRGPFSWIIAMAGFAPRPAEDATGDEPEEQKGKAPVQQPQQKQPESAGTGGSTGNVISEKQAKRIWGIAFSYNVPRNIVGEILRGHGFTDSDPVVAAANVTKDKYETICAAIENAGGGDGK